VHIQVEPRCEIRGEEIQEQLEAGGDGNHHDREGEHAEDRIGGRGGGRVEQDRSEGEPQDRRDERAHREPPRTLISGETTVAITRPTVEATTKPKTSS
jgi:hypothetical protein